MTTNRTTFQAALLDASKVKEEAENASLTLLVELHGMATTFHLEWLEAYHRMSVKGEKAETIEKELRELSPEFDEIVKTAQITDKALPSDANKKAVVIKNRERARARRNTIQTTMRKAISCLVCLRSLDVESAKINTYKKLVIKFRTGDGVETLTESFSSLAKIGEAKAKELGWLKADPKPDNRVTNAADPSTPAETNNKKTVSLSPAGTGTTFGHQLQSMTMLLMSLDFAQLNDDNAELIRQLEETIIRKNYASENGRIDTKLLVEQYQDVKAISTGDTREPEAAAA